MDDIHGINISSADGNVIPRRSLVEVRTIIGRRRSFATTTARGDSAGRPGAGRVLGSGAGGDGSGCGADAAARLPWRNLDPPSRRSGAEGKQPEPPGLCAAVRLPVPGRSFHELHDPDPGRWLSVTVRCGRIVFRVPRWLGLTLDLDRAESGTVVLIRLGGEER